MNEDAFVEAMLDDPNDVVTRLVFADWLQDREDPRGEFLRIQTELEQWVPDHVQRFDLLQRQRDLLQRHESEWLGPLRNCCDSWEWRGGMATLCLDARRFLSWSFSRAAPIWLRRAWVRRIRLTHIQDARSLARADHLRLIRELDLTHANVNDAALLSLTTSRCLDQLRVLRLDNNPISSSGIRFLVRSPLMEQLKELGLRNTYLDVTGADLLTQFLGKRGLCELDVQGVELSPWFLRHWSTHQGKMIPPSSHLVNHLGMQFQRIPAGSFLMGSALTEEKRWDDEGPVHPVVLTQSFYLGTYAVTQEQFARVLGFNPSYFGPNNFGRSNHPVENVSWQDANEFCERLSAFPEERLCRRRYRLPTEAEWEYACRAGGFPEEPFHFGDSLSSQHANINGELPYGTASPDTWRQHTVPVGSFPANAFGLYDMHGNTWEWCQDSLDRNFYEYSPTVDPVALGGSPERVCRGGSWHSPAFYCRSASRGADRLDARDRYFGMRVVVETVAE